MDASECFVQDNYYYLCEAEPEAVRQNLDAYEAQETYTLEYVTPLMAIQKNRSVGASPYNPMMFEREASVTSQKNRISVGNENMPPEIVSIPSDLTVEQGDLAEIRCVAKPLTARSFPWWAIVLICAVTAGIGFGVAFAVIKKKS